MGELYLINQEMFSADTGDGLEILAELSLEEVRELDRLGISGGSTEIKARFVEDHDGQPKRLENG
jgi:hypothetical protein